jgi:hypothetical protein
MCLWSVYKYWREQVGSVSNNCDLYAEDDQFELRFLVVLVRPSKQVPLEYHTLCRIHFN